MNRDYFIERNGKRWGFQFSPVQIRGKPYLDRYIVYLGKINLRLHKFYRGDDDRAPHTHPWWFITFPFSSYIEEVYVRGAFVEHRIVRAWRFHRRAATFEHIVIARLGEGAKPWWSFVIAGERSNCWGFWPKPGKFIDWRDWT